MLDVARSFLCTFGRYERDAYFEQFSHEASVVFHTIAAALPTREAYEQLWSRWESELGFRVLSCKSRYPTVQLFGDTAVFRPRVRTTIQVLGGESRLDERETIVFHRGSDGRWLAVHEHLSAMPATNSWPAP